MATTIQDLRAIKAKYEKMLKDDGKAILGEAFKAFFDKAPHIQAVRWKQYTPHFNDGEPCEFRLGEPSYKPVEPLAGENSDYDDGFYEVWSDDTRKKLKITKQADGILGDVFEDDVMLAVFGDHVQVTATREGFEVDSYDHD